MRSPFADPVTPLRRFEAMQQALPHHDATQRIGMLLAALASVPASGAPSRVAASVIAHAGMLGRGEGNALPETLSYQIAAMLTVAGIGSGKFQSILERAHRIFHEHDLETETAAEALAVATLVMHGGVAGVSDGVLIRTTTIHRLMLSRHWWVNVPADVPTSALLAGQEARPRDLERRVESHYLQLMEKGFAGGAPLHVAAALLTAADERGEHAFQRFLGLAQAFGQQPRLLHAPALALLGLLPHAADHVIAQHQAIVAYLASHVLSAGPAIDSILAAGLTYLDLEPFQADGTPCQGAGEQARHRHLIHLLEATVACLAALTPMPQLTGAEPSS